MKLAKKWKWAAMDMNGEIFLYETKPTISEDLEAWVNTKGDDFFGKATPWPFRKKDFPYSKVWQWRGSLVKLKEII